MLDQNQAEDQAGFRKTYQTTDHFATYRMMEQKCQEWRIKMWTATVDFTKAFDSISHNSIWEALLSCNVDDRYVCLLRKIYKDQKASVQTDEESESFDIQKGSKKGDPMSSLLFNTVLQYSFKKRNTTMAKEKRNGNLLDRPRTRLPDELAICDFPAALALGACLQLRRSIGMDCMRKIPSQTLSCFPVLRRRTTCSDKHLEV